MGATPTVQGTRVRASPSSAVRQQAVHDGDGLQLQLAADEQVEPFLLLGAVGLLASGEEGRLLLLISLPEVGYPSHSS